jgi:hypothetical protein
MHFGSTSNANVTESSSIRKEHALVTESRAHPIFLDDPSGAIVHAAESDSRARWLESALGVCARTREGAQMGDASFSRQRGPGSDMSRSLLVLLGLDSARPLMSKSKHSEARTVRHPSAVCRKEGAVTCVVELWSRCFGLAHLLRLELHALRHVPDSLNIRGELQLFHRHASTPP